MTEQERTRFVVDYRATYRGEIEVEASSVEEAKELVQEDLAGTGWAFEADDQPFVEFDSVFGGTDA